MCSIPSCSKRQRGSLPDFDGTSSGATIVTIRGDMNGELVLDSIPKHAANGCNPPSCGVVVGEL